jgi:hypothetical protein
VEAVAGSNQLYGDPGGWRRIFFAYEGSYTPRR